MSAVAGEGRGQGLGQAPGAGQGRGRGPGSLSGPGPAQSRLVGWPAALGVLLRKEGNPICFWSGTMVVVYSKATEKVPNGFSKNRCDCPSVGIGEAVWEKRPWKWSHNRERSELGFTLKL